MILQADIHAMIYTITGNRLICELFVSKGADIAICDSLGRTAAWHAMDAGHTSVKQSIDPSPPLAAKNLKGDTEVSDVTALTRVYRRSK